MLVDTNSWVYNRNTWVLGLVVQVFRSGSDRILSDPSLSNLKYLNLIIRILSVQVWFGLVGFGSVRVIGTNRVIRIYWFGFGSVHVESDPKIYSKHTQIPEKYLNTWKISEFLLKIWSEGIKDTLTFIQLSELYKSKILPETQNYIQKSKSET